MNNVNVTQGKSAKDTKQIKGKRKRKQEDLVHEGDLVPDGNFVNNIRLRSTPQAAAVHRRPFRGRGGRGNVNRYNSGRGNFTGQGGYFRSSFRGNSNRDSFRGLSRKSRRVDFADRSRGNSFRSGSSYRERSRSRPAQGQIECYECKGIGHMKRSCPSRGRSSQSQTRNRSDIDRNVGCFICGNNHYASICPQRSSPGN